MTRTELTLRTNIAFARIALLRAEVALAQSLGSRPNLAKQNSHQCFAPGPGAMARYIPPFIRF